ncbi:MAG TPA: hypothetical protein PK262_03730, partial [Bacteroidales bacterium]|nr:hypothetical protein [Bacteroidales bacterium]
MQGLLYLKLVKKICNYEQAFFMYFNTCIFSFVFHFDIKGEIFIQESFSGSTLPSGWTNTAIQG